MANRKRNGDKRNIEPSSKVKRCLFGKPDTKEREAESERNNEETTRQMETMKEKYNFDFENDKPLQLPNARFTEWEKVESSDNHSDVHGDGRQSADAFTAAQSYTEIERQSNATVDETDSNNRSHDGAYKQDNSSEQDSCLS